jgi:hypothetical protein
MNLKNNLRRMLKGIDEKLRTIKIVKIRQRTLDL